MPDERLVGDVGGRGRLPARAAHLQRQGGRDRPLLRRPAGGARRPATSTSTPPSTATAPSSPAPSPEGFPLKVTNLVDQLPALRAPLLGLFGAEDNYPSPEQVAELDGILTEHGKDVEFHSYDGAGHAFFAVDRPSYNVAAANDGWERVADFFARNLGS